MAKKTSRSFIAVWLWVVLWTVVIVSALLVDYDELSRKFKEQFYPTQTSVLQIEMELAEAVYLKARLAFEAFRPEVKKVQELIVKYETDNEKLCEYLLTSNYHDIFAQDAKNTEKLMVAAHTIKKLAEQGITSQIILNPADNFKLLFSLSVLSNVVLLETAKDEADCKRKMHI